MRSVLILALIMLTPALASAGKQVTYDDVTFTPPAPHNKKAWIRDLTKKKDSTSYTMTDPATGTHCQIFIFKSIISEGDLAADFASEWKTIVLANYAIKDPPQMTETAEQDGWTVKAGVGTFEFAGSTTVAMLTTVSGNGRATSIVAVTNGQEYAGAIQDLLGSISLKRHPAAGAKTTAKTPAAKTAKPQALQGYMEYSPFTKTWTWKVRYPPT